MSPPQSSTKMTTRSASPEPFQICAACLAAASLIGEAGDWKLQPGSEARVPSLESMPTGSLDCDVCKRQVRETNETIGRESYSLGRWLAQDRTDEPFSAFWDMTKSRQDRAAQCSWPLRGGSCVVGSVDGRGVAK